MPFDYSAPAELFLAKPMKDSSTKYRRFRLRPFATPLRSYAHPKPSARTWRSGMSASTATKSNACTKRAISLRRDGEGRNRQDAPQLNQICYFSFTAAASSTVVTTRTLVVSVAIETYDFDNLFEWIIQRERGRSSVPRKGERVPAHRVDQH